MLSSGGCVPIFRIITKSHNGRISSLFPRLSTLAQNVPAYSSSPTDSETIRHTKVGITEFMGNCPRVIATIKEKPADFQVHEIDKYGRKVQLTNLVPPEPYSINNKSKQYTKNVNVNASKHVHCTLYKEGIEQTDAINFMAKRLRVNPEQIYYAGRKDKIAQTTQRISFPTTDSAENIAKISASWQMTRLGNYTFSSKSSIKYGKSQGNHFKILLRNIQLPTENSSQDPILVLENAIKSLDKVGYINYWGLQRFGHNCHRVGAAILKADWDKAYDRMLVRKPNDWVYVKEAKDCWFSTRDPVKCLQLIPPDYHRFDARAHIFYNLARHKDPKIAFQNLPKSTRTLYFTAFTSLVWNKLITNRLKKLGHQVLPGDFVQVPVSNSTFENSWLGAHPSETKSDRQNIHIVSHGDKEFKKLTVEDLGKGHPYSIYDVHVPVLGTKLQRHEHEQIQEIYQSILKEDDLPHDCFKLFSDLILRDEVNRGFYRPLLVRPEALKYEILPYNNSDDLNSLMPSDLDLLKMNGTFISVNPDPRAFPRREQEKRLKMYSKTDGVKDKLGAIIEFILPTSSYATMALREILQTANFISS